MNNLAINIQRLRVVAKALAELREQTVFVGGSIMGFHVDHEIVADLRPTKDVDCVIDVIFAKGRYALESRLRQLGFNHAVNDDVICRWRIDGVTVDVMTPDERDFGFTNRWYKDVLVESNEIDLGDIMICIASAAGLLAMKLEAFHDRGKDDYMASHDFEDIVTLLDGCKALEASIMACSEEMRVFIQDALSGFMHDDNFSEQLRYQWRDALIADDAADLVKDSINRIIHM